MLRVIFGALLVALGAYGVYDAASYFTTRLAALERSNASCAGGALATPREVQPVAAASSAAYDDSALAARVAALEARRVAAPSAAYDDGALVTRVAALEAALLSRIEALERAPRGLDEATALAGRLDALEVSVAAVASRLDDATIAAPEAAPELEAAAREADEPEAASAEALDEPEGEDTASTETEDTAEADAHRAAWAAAAEAESRVEVPEFASGNGTAAAPEVDEAAAGMISAFLAAGDAYSARGAVAEATKEYSKAIKRGGGLAARRKRGALLAASGDGAALEDLVAVCEAPDGGGCDVDAVLSIARGLDASDPRAAAAARGLLSLGDDVVGDAARKLAADVVADHGGADAVDAARLAGALSGDEDACALWGRLARLTAADRGEDPALRVARAAAHGHRCRPPALPGFAPVLEELAFVLAAEGDDAGAEAARADLRDLAAAEPEPAVELETSASDAEDEPLASPDEEMLSAMEEAVVTNEATEAPPLEEEEAPLVDEDLDWDAALAALADDVDDEDVEDPDLAATDDLIADALRRLAGVADDDEPAPEKDAPAPEEAPPPPGGGEAPPLVASDEAVEELRRSLPPPRWMRGRRAPPPEALLDDD